MCLSRYVCLPIPCREWDEDLQPVSEVFLPAVGLVIGLVWWILALLSWWLLPGFLGAALVALYPFAVTGFENMCAFTRIGAPILARRGIVKQDIGMRVLPMVLMLLQFSVCMSLDSIFALVLIPVLSRSCLVLMQMKPAKREAEAESEDMQVPVALVRIEKGVAVGALLLLLLFAGVPGLICGAAVLASSWAILRAFAGEGQGICDDLRAFALTAAEFCGLLVLSIL